MAGILLLGVSGRAESVQSSSETPAAKEETSAQEKGKSYNLLRPYRPFNPFSTSFSVKPKMAPPSSAGQTPAATKRDDELIDRQKNWIFATPKEQSADERAADALGGDAWSFGSRSKGVVNQFLTQSREKGQPTPADEKNEEKFSPQFGLGREKKPEVNSLTAHLPQDDARERRFNSYSDRETQAAEFFRDQKSAAGERLRDDKELRMKEFEGLFGARGDDGKSTGPGLFGENNTSGFKPASSSRGPVSLFNPGGFSSSSDPFKPAPRSAPGASTVVRPDINTRTFGVSAAPVPTPAPQRSVSQPAVLPIPKRHF